MATASIAFIAALRRTAGKLGRGAAYQWGHMGSCNCGNLAQELTQYTAPEIHRNAIACGRGDWNEQLNDYCPSTGLQMDSLIFEMLTHGVTLDDLRHLERLSDPHILNRLPGGHRHLRHNNREDLVLYLTTWAGVLEEEWTARLAFGDIRKAIESLPENTIAPVKDGYPAAF